MKKRKIPLLGWVLLLTLALVFLALGCQTNVPSSTTVRGGQAGTTLSAEKTATGFWKRVITYDWSIEKSANLSEDGKSIVYTLTATRTKVSERDTYGVFGTITVTNGGMVKTENLKLVDQVEYKTGSGQFQPLPGASQTITPQAQLEPRATGIYHYEITFTPVHGATYRNLVKVTITNHSGRLGEEFGPEPKESFSLPATPTIIEVDKTASVEDDLECPPGFTCTITDSGYPTWDQIGTGSDANPYTWTVTYTLTPTQGSTICETVVFNNTATLTKSDSKKTITASAGVSWDCAQSGGCTYTQGYWKTHSKYGPAKPYNPTWAKIGEDTPFFLSGQSYYQVLWTTPSKGNVYYILAHQYIAARLNILNGASYPTAVNEAMTWAESFFNTYKPTASLNKTVKNQATQYANLLDQYNNGHIGPGHCSTE